MDANEELDAVERSGLMTAYWRALENNRSDRLLADYLASDFATSAAGAKERSRFDDNPLLGTYVDAVAVRARAIDNIVLSWCAAGVEQVVNLGCGLDARPWRLPIPRRTHFYHVDSRRMLDFVRQRFSDPAQCDIKWVTGDLADSEGVLCVLREAGLTGCSPVGWILEGVLEYLDANARMSLIHGAALESMTGSRIAATVLDPAILRLAVDDGDAAFPWRSLPSLSDALDAFLDWDCRLTSLAEVGRILNRQVPAVGHVVEGSLRASRKSA